MKTMLSWETAFLSPPMIISHHFPFCFKCDLACPKAKNPEPNLACKYQSQSWRFLSSGSDIPKSLLHSSTFSAAPHSPAAPTELSQFRTDLQQPHSFAPNCVFPSTQSESPWNLLTMEHYSLSKPGVTCAPAPHTCQADLSLQRFRG